MQLLQRGLYNFKFPFLYAHFNWGFFTLKKLSLLYENPEESHYKSVLLGIAIPGMANKKLFRYFN